MRNLDPESISAILTDLKKINVTKIFLKNGVGWGRSPALFFMRPYRLVNRQLAVIQTGLD